MKTTLIKGAAIFLLVLSITSCEKVIDVKLKNADKKYVVEGIVSNDANQSPEVKISQTKKFEDDNSFVGISGAKVTIQVNNLSVYLLSETSPGIYRTTSFAGSPGSTYKLSVTVGDETFTAVSTMPAQVVNLDKLGIIDYNYGGEIKKTVTVSYKDPEGFGNNYRAIEYINDKQVKEVYVVNDDLGDGTLVTQTLGNSEDDLKTGDIIKVDMFEIDKNIYKYWLSLGEGATGESGFSTPSNPITNISGGALGCFSAHIFSSKTIVVE